MKVTPGQLRRIIREALTSETRILSEGSWGESSNAEKAAAMLGYLQKYTTDDAVDAESRMGRVMQMADTIEALVAARDADAEPSVSGKSAGYLKKIKKTLEEDEGAVEDLGGYDKLVEIGMGLQIS